VDFRIVHSLQSTSNATAMAKPSSKPGSEPTSTAHAQLVQGLQDDLAREYKAIIQYVIFSQKLDTARYMNIADQLEEHAHQELNHALAVARQLDYLGAYPVHVPAPVEISEDNEEMLWADLRAEDSTIRNYRERIRQAEALGEIALAETLRAIVKEEQDHQIDLATALGVVPDDRRRREKGPSGTA
jgi:bacterioferritin